MMAKQLEDQIRYSGCCVIRLRKSRSHGSFGIIQDAKSRTTRALDNSSGHSVYLQASETEGMHGTLPLSLTVPASRASPQLSASLTHQPYYSSLKHGPVSQAWPSLSSMADTHRANVVSSKSWSHSYQLTMPETI